MKTIGDLRKSVPNGETTVITPFVWRSEQFLDWAPDQNNIEHLVLADVLICVHHNIEFFTGWFYVHCDMHPITPVMHAARRDTVGGVGYYNSTPLGGSSNEHCGMFFELEADAVLFRMGRGQ